VIENLNSNGGKVRLDLILPEFIMAVGEVLTGGAIKYSDYGWKTVPNAEAEYTGAIFRHLMKVMMGETKDADSGESHYAHIAADAMVLFWHELQKKKKLLASAPIQEDRPFTYANTSVNKVTPTEDASKELTGLAKPDVKSLIGKTGMFWDYNNSCEVAFFGELTGIQKENIKYPFLTDQASGMFRNFYLTPKEINLEIVELDPYRRYTKKDHVGE